MKKTIGFLEFAISLSLFMVIVSGIIGFFETRMFGSKIRNDILQSVDTYIITENYESFDFFNSKLDNKNAIRVSFDSFHTKDKLLSENVDIDVYIFEDNLFSNKGNVKKKVYYTNFSKYTNTVTIEKENVLIVATENTDTPRSGEIEKCIEYVISQFVYASKS